MSVCLKRLKELNKVRLVDASFIWTEPHSKRIKLKLVVQKEVINHHYIYKLSVITYMYMTYGLVHVIFHLFKSAGILC